MSVGDGDGITDGQSGVGFVFENDGATDGKSNEYFFGEYEGFSDCQSDKDDDGTEVSVWTFVTIGEDEGECVSDHV